MKFVSVRELRSRSAADWRSLAREKDVVGTSNGKSHRGSLGYDGIDRGSVARRAAAVNMMAGKTSRQLSESGKGRRRQAGGEAGTLPAPID